MKRVWITLTALGALCCLGNTDCDKEVQAEDSPPKAGVVLIFHGVGSDIYRITDLKNGLQAFPAFTAASGHPVLGEA